MHFKVEMTRDKSNNKPLTSFVVAALTLPVEADEERAEEILAH